MNGNPTVSVILPTFNRADLIERSIRSVLAQTWQNFELIIVDDGSKDNTEQILAKFDDERIVFIKQSKNRGSAHARNEGLKISRGIYIAFQDSDDEWMPNKLEKQLIIVSKKDADFGVVYSDMLRINNNGTEEYWDSPDIKFGELINPLTLDYQVYRIGIGSALIKKECFINQGYFDERLRRFIDLDLFIRFSKYYRFYHIKSPLVKYYATEGISSNLNELCISRLLLLTKYYYDIRENDDFILNQYTIIINALQEQREQISAIKEKLNY
jgi:glycosyltransferase involved in cell wall biosynthesis